MGLGEEGLLPLPLYCLFFFSIVAKTTERSLLTTFQDSDHDFAYGALLRVATLQNCHRYARRNAMAWPNAYTNRAHGHSGHVAAPNRSPSARWHTTRAAQETKCAVSTTCKLVRLREWELWSVVESSREGRKI